MCPHSNDFADILMFGPVYLPTWNSNTKFFLVILSFDTHSYVFHFVLILVNVNLAFVHLKSCHEARVNVQEVKFSVFVLIAG